MLNFIAQDLAECTLATFGTPLSPVAVSAANAVFLQLAQAPYFEGNHDRFVLIQRGEAFWQVHHLVYSTFESADPLRRVYDDFFDWSDADHHPEPQVPHPPTFPYGQTKMDPFEGVLPVNVQAAVHRLASAFQANYPQWAFLTHPSPEDLVRRHAYQLETFDGASAMHERLRPMLGDEHDMKLRAEGILYHSPIWPSREKKDHRYLLMHNGREVVGLLHYIVREQDHGLAFVSVAPGFRRHRVGERLYDAFIEETRLAGRVIKRSDPSDYAEKNPGVTRFYDRLLSERPVLHTTNRGYFYTALCHAVKRYPYDDVLRIAKPLCDALTEDRAQRGGFAFDAGEPDHRWTVALKEALATLDPAPGTVSTGNAVQAKRHRSRSPGR